MNFDAFLKYIPQILTENLPGDDAHLEMMPLERIAIFKDLDLEKINPREASVMMLFYPKNDAPHLVMILRNSYKGVHSSQIGFPGGKVEKFDGSLADTALRETFEEIGVDRQLITIVRPFTALYIPPSNFKVYPFLGYATQELAFIPDDREVFGIIEMPLSVLMDDTARVSKTLSTSYMEEVDVPAFKFEEHYVWGATSQMLNELKEVLKRVF
ncbi:8-oxo-dGTP pyrophosphatase MutT (NUDIX family) [Flavobacterium arsenatis]|uniref:8-oxo-dGTP pyrophosphatase MutT (NUDIX family) n=1 Tax=Flavobacterium arsenatis TaxID=1484332 RepID=A0ABU1TNP1_9FLAO|nr:CoA pyrophosphatase [Flavobacterium arsenatis]MDR6967584.1 8-oxo-dGTP pyrophosphatase MutT (NUDIX family) [Flavobacterium arsenatis]